MISLPGFLRFCLQGFFPSLRTAILPFLPFLPFLPSCRMETSSVDPDRNSWETTVTLASSQRVSDSGKTIPMHLFYRKAELPTGDDSLLVGESRLLVDHTEPEVLALSALKELSLPSEKGNLPAVPGEAVPLHVFFPNPGTAVVNYNRSLSAGLVLGAEAETACIYAIVHTITLNFPGVSTVKLLIEGKEQETLAGHIGISRGLHTQPLLIEGYGDLNGSLRAEPLPP